MGTQHTPTPWVYPRDDSKAPDLAIFSTEKPKNATSEHGACVAHVQMADAVTGLLPRGQYEANAEFIVRAVNNHERLVAALKDALRAVTEIDNAHKSLRAIRAALKEAAE